MDQQLKGDIAELYARFCGALADPNRIMMLYVLSENRCNVGCMAERLQLPQPTVSRHLKILRDRGLVESARDGQMVYYRITDPRIIEALDLLREVIGDQLKGNADLADKLT